MINPDKSINYFNCKEVCTDSFIRCLSDCSMAGTVLYALVYSMVERQQLSYNVESMKIRSAQGAKGERRSSMQPRTLMSRDGNCHFTDGTTL